MFTVRQTVRYHGKEYIAGSYYEPADVLEIKDTDYEKFLVEITAKSYPIWKDYFLRRYNMELKAPPVKKQEKK